MHAWTIPQPFASLILMGAMPYWMSPEAVPARLIEERVAIFSHPSPASPRDVILTYENIFFEASVGTGIDADIAGELITRMRADVESGTRISRVPLGQVLGTVQVGRSRMLTEIFPDDCEVPPHLHAWPLSHPDTFIRPKLATPPLAEFWEWES